MIIGLSGLIGAGKGAVSDILTKKCGYMKMSFADSLKDATASIFGWPRELLEGDTKESREYREKVDPVWTENLKDSLGKEITPRYVLQYMGTEVMRDTVHQEIWIQSLHKKILNNIDKNIVITDVRFPNEFQFIRSLGGINVRVKKGDDPPWYYTACMVNSVGVSRQFDMVRDYPEVHLSEWASAGEKIDTLIHNNGSLKDLEETITQFIRKRFH